MAESDINRTEISPWSVQNIQFGPIVYATANRALVRPEFTSGLPHKWKKEGFDYQEYISTRRQGMFLEVAGPTEKWELAGPEGLDNFFVSDLSPDPGLDLIVDARDFPIKPCTLDGVFVSYITGMPDPDEICTERDDTTKLLYQEAIKALKPSGIVVQQRAFRYMVEQAIKAGLELVQFEREDALNGAWNIEGWNCIFQKPAV